MLRLVKWAYDLGVRNERHRIASYLQSAQAKRFDMLRAFDDDMRLNPIDSKADAAKRNIQKREQQKAVDEDVISIIDGIFHGEEKYERGASIMFPEGEVK